MQSGKIIPQPIEVHSDEWLNILEKPLMERANYKQDEAGLSYGQLAIKLLGTPFDIDEYYNQLYNLKHQSNIKITVLNEEFDKTISNEKIKAITNVLDYCRKEPNISTNRFVAFLKGNNLIPLGSRPNLHRHIQYTLIEVLQTFHDNHSGGFNDPDFRRVITDLVKFLWNHIDKWYSSIAFEREVPKVLWYGDASKSLVYVLYFLIELGCDLVYFHPEKKDIFSGLTKLEHLPVYNYPSSNKLEPFPTEISQRKSTIAHRASLEYETMLQPIESGFFKPWQLREYIPASLTLKTTYDEVFIIADAKAFIRPEFQVKNSQVIIPNIFCKVSGISTDKKEYWSRIKAITASNLALCIQCFPFAKSVKANYLYHFRQSLGQDGKLSVEKIMCSNCWPYKGLALWLQQAIANAIVRYCSNPKLLKLPYETQEDLQVTLFKQALVIPEEIIKLLQRFDYTQDIPKIILYNNGNHGEFSRSDACILLLLNELGVDIVIYNPGGTPDLENYIDEDIFDNHWLDEMVLGQEFNKKDLSLSKLFKRLLGDFV